MAPRLLVSETLRLDLIDERLWRGSEAVPLGGKAYALLRAFMEHPQTVLTKDQLLERAWPGITVSDSVLTTAVKDLRRALGDDARNPTIIRTVHGRGYRFMLPVETVDSDAPSAGPEPVAISRRKLVGAVAGLCLVGGAAGIYSARRATTREAPAKSIAVLPFRDFSERRDQRWFADGLSEEVLTSLSRTPDLKVVSQQVSSRYRDRERDPRAVARNLGVAQVLEGSVRRSGERIRVTVNLIRGADGAHIWSQTYDRRDADVISMQQDIAVDIARAMKTVTDPSALRAMASAGTRSAEAYHAYLRGLSLNQREQAGGEIGLARQASDEFDRARSIDPGFAAAHWRAAQHWYGDAVGINPPDRGGLSEADLLERYLSRVDRAVMTTTDEVARLKYAAAANLARLQLVEARRRLEAYVRVRPADIDGWESLTNLAGYMGDQALRVRAAERFHALSLRDRMSQGWSISASILTADYAVALHRAQEHLQAEPENPYVQFQAHRAMVAGGHPLEARRLLRRIEASGLPAATRDLAALRQACAEGRVFEAQAARRRIEDEGSRATRWFAAQAVGDTKGAEAVLRPLDRPDLLPILIQFAAYPSFDARAFPVLEARLTQQGVRRPPPVTTPYACRYG